MLVSLYGSTAVTLDLMADVTWQPSGGQGIGSATVRLNRDSAAWHEDVISEFGGMLVRISTPAGDWMGIADSPVFSPAGAELRCQHIHAWMKTQHVSTVRRLHGLTAGAIARRALQDAMIGLGSVPVTPGSFVEAPPVLAAVDFRGQSLLSVLTDLQNQTGQVWVLDNRLRFHWRQQGGQYREHTLIDDGQYLSTLQRTPLADQYAQDIEVERSGRTFTARNPDAPALWPAQRITRVD